MISGFQVLRQARAPVAGTRAHDRRVPADLRADSLATVPRTSRIRIKELQPQWIAIFPFEICMQGPFYRGFEPYTSSFLA
ncbi:hypothetical protein PoB_004882200 [Plakobranchus ocellatus]|uniref:Uncharacterized protein n=1 Tax=Plakobranchus ocellatus TaxID=259542 RepID=A0AAV4BSK7_9GAST|nr:hypothetical protein PoB_004882200 [Plakobranchus ocellatus]